jgi:hypothetical protein
MATLNARADGHVDAGPDLVLDIIRDFRGHHPNILPPAFSDFRVVEGGYGAGTVTSFTTTLGGRAVAGRTIVSEPGEGVMREDVEGTDMVTFFRVTPERDGSHVEIATTWTAGAGINGLLERLFAPGMLTKVYREEVGLLQGYAAKVAWTR